MDIGREGERISSFNLKQKKMNMDGNEEVNQLKIHILVMERRRMTEMMQPE